MDAVFLEILNMSAASSWVVFVVLLVRLVLRKAPRWLTCLLWALVAIRLICPFSPESVLSLIPESVSSGETVMKLTGSYSGPSSSYWDHSEEFDIAVESGIDPIYGGEGHYYVITGEDPETPVGTVYGKLTPVWLLGILVMLACAMVSYRKIAKQVAVSLLVANGLYLCDYIETPFILGIVRPKIYLPSSMDPNAAAHVLAHERAHIQRKDHWWKPLGYGLLTLHWFNPVMWLAYLLLCRDIELACDEKVIRQMEAVDKKAYSEALLSCSVPRHMIAACPLAFGEVDVKARVKSVLNYKRPSFWAVVVAVVLCVVVAVCFLTDPVSDNSIAKLAGIENLEYESVTLTVRSSVVELHEDREIRKVIDFLERATMERDPVSQERIEKDSDYSIAFGNTSICFDSYFTCLWINDGVKPSFPYRIGEQTDVIAFFEEILDVEIPDPVPTEPLGEQSLAGFMKISEENLEYIRLTNEFRYVELSTENEISAVMDALRSCRYDPKPISATKVRNFGETVGCIYHMAQFVYGDTQLYIVLDKDCTVMWGENEGGTTHLYAVQNPDVMLDCFEKFLDTKNDNVGYYVGHEYEWLDDFVQVSFGDVKVSLQMLADWQYEIVEYSENGESFGIRCRPEAVADGWVYYSYWPEGFDETGDKKCHVRDHNDPENFAVILEGETDWIADYDDQFHDLDLHAECILENAASFNMINANMQLTLPEGWEYKIQRQKEETDPFGIKFRPIDQEGWLKLLFWPEGFSVCGTGLVMDNALNLSNGLKASAGYYDGNEIWSFLRFYDLPGEYIVLNDGADSWIPAYETEIMQILNHAVLARGIITQAEAEKALQNVAGDISYTDKQWKYDYRFGVWTVELTQENPDIVQIYRFDHMGNVIIESE